MGNKFLKYLHLFFPRNSSKDFGNSLFISLRIKIHQKNIISFLKIPNSSMRIGDLWHLKIPERYSFYLTKLTLTYSANSEVFLP